MIDTDFNAVIDISSIIWDKDDFNENKYEYYNLIIEVSNLFEKTKNLEINILIRDELLAVLIDEFPSDQLPNKHYEVVNIIYTFLANASSNFINYSDRTLAGLNSIPNLIKSYYNDITKEEVGYLISKIHSDSDSAIVYFTFSYLWNGNGNLKTETKNKTNTYETVIANNGTNLDDFFEKFEPKFEHNSKHDKKPNNTREKWLHFANKNAFDSRLSCYNGVDGTQPQKILDNKYPQKIGEEYIGYDDINEVWVRFKCHEDNLYHGFDEYDEDNIEKIPLKVRKHFNK